jgi:hypothetical protein
MNHFLSAKKLLEQAGEISPRSYRDYEQTCDHIAACLGDHHLLTDIDHTDLENLRAALYKGKRLAVVSPTTAKGDQAISPSREALNDSLNSFAGRDQVVWRSWTSPAICPLRRRIAAAGNCDDLGVMQEAVEDRRG